MPWKSDRSVVPDRFRAYPGAPARTGRRRIAVLSPYAPFPLAHGGAVRLYNLLQQAAAEFDLYLVFFSDPLTDSQVNALANIAVKTFVFDRPRYREPRWSSLRPPEVNEFDVPAVSALLKRLREQEGVELVQVEYTQLATYTADVLVEHDVTFDLYEQIHTRQPSLQSWWDLFRWRRFERGAVRNFRSVIVMSEKDRLMLGIPRTTVVPNGVDLERFRPTADHGSGNVLFVGSFSHFPNIVAFRFLTEEIWPAVIAHCPQATLTVVAGPDADLHWTRHTGTAALPEVPRAAVHGFVADVRPLYEAADVVVVPTRVSAGTNLKVLEAMAAGRALVTTPSGCGGIPLEHGVSALIAGDGEKFASAIASLLNDGALRAALAREARTIAEREFGWDALGKRQREVWRNLLGREHVHLRPGRPGDLGRIGEIEASSGESAHWEPETYLEYELTVATMNGTVAGFMVTRNTVEREREILNIAVAPEFRRRGVASALIHGVNAGDIFLEVRESNHAARALYRKLGFAEVGFRPGYYDNPPETAVVMRLTRN